MAKPKTYDSDWGGFTKLFHEPMKTDLWKELKAHDVFVFAELLSKRKQGLFGKPDTFILTPSMMKGRICGPTFYASIRNLIQRGFIEIVEHGGIGAEGKHRANVFILSMKWREVIKQRETKRAYLLPRPWAPGYKPPKRKKGGEEKGEDMQRDYMQNRRCV
jgi:hypothetical protein